MGTQSSYKGPGDKNLLLPDWALLNPESGEPEDADAPGEAEQPEQAEQPTDVASDGLPAIQEVKPKKIKVPKPWQTAKLHLSKALKGGSSKDNLRRAAKSYVRALGGSVRGARTAVSGRSSTASLAGFLSSVARNGLESSLRSLRLAAVVGKDPHTVFAAVVNAICPPGDSREDVAARESTSEALWDLFAVFLEDDNDATALDALTAEQITRCLLDAIAAYIYRRWLGDLGIKVEQHAVSPEKAIRLEREMKTFLREAVQLDFQDKNVLTVDWNGREGKALVESMYQQALVVITE